MARWNYGPPKYDISNKAGLNRRILEQAGSNSPTMIYSSHWHDFGREFLRGNRVVEKGLRRVASRSLMAMRVTVPTGDADQGHMKSSLRIVKVRNAGFRHDRTGYKVDYVGPKPKAWNAAVRRSTFSSNAEFKNAGRGVYGPIPSWINKAAKMTGGD